MYVQSLRYIPKKSSGFVIWNLISKLSTTDFRVFFFVVFSYYSNFSQKCSPLWESQISHQQCWLLHLRISYWRPIELQSIRSLSAAGHWKSTALCHEPSYTTRSTRTFKSSLRSTLRVNGRCGSWNLQQDVSWALVGWMEFGKAKLMLVNLLSAKQFALQCLYQLPKSAVHLKQKCWVSKWL